MDAISKFLGLEQGTNPLYMGTVKTSMAVGFFFVYIMQFVTKVIGPKSRITVVLLSWGWGKFQIATCT